MARQVQKEFLIGQSS